MVIKIRLPRVPAGAWTNIVGLLGLVGVVVAIGGLTGNWWWSVLSGGVCAVGLAYVAQTHAEVAHPEAAAAPGGRPTVVNEAA